MYGATNVLTRLGSVGVLEFLFLWCRILGTSRGEEKGGRITG